MLQLPNFFVPRPASCLEWTLKDSWYSRLLLKAVMLMKIFCQSSLESYPLWILLQHWHKMIILSSFLAFPLVAVKMSVCLVSYLLHVQEADYSLKYELEKLLHQTFQRLYSGHEIH